MLLIISSMKKKSRVQIGNAVLNDATDQLGMVEYAWSHAIISDELYSAVRRECDSFKEEADGGRPGKGCSPALRAFLGAYDDIDIYSIYTPTCLLPATGAGTSAAPRRPAARLVAAPRLFSEHVRASSPNTTRSHEFDHKIRLG